MNFKKFLPLIAATLVALGVASSAARKWRDMNDIRAKRRALLKRLLETAASYAQWREIAHQLYKLEEPDLPQENCMRGSVAKLYDLKLLRDKITHLQRVRHTGNAKELMLALRTDLIRNIANIAKSQLHEYFVLIPEPIQRYLREVKEQLMLLLEWPDEELGVDEKLAFFRETRHTFGRTALLLSGGGGLGTFHIGVCKTLFEQSLLPRVLAGSSVGSIVAAIIATRTDSELRDLFTRLDHFDISFFKNSRAVELVHHFMSKGSLQDMSYMIKKLRSLLGDQTFLEAYERTGRILNVTVCPADTNEPPRLLNYLTAPNALIWSAVAASSAFPGLYPAQNILAHNSAGEVISFSAQSSNDSLERRWRDGSLELDLPVQALGEMFNCNHFMVSQTNPHIVPLLNLKKCFSRKWANILEAELKHRCQVLQWLLPDWVPSKWLMLFTQTWEGDVTMTLPYALWRVGKAIVNPTTEELIKAVKVGEVATWEKLSAIECNCSIEATLDKCLAAITNRARGHRMHRMGNRIPSWLHMTALGLPAVASWGDDLASAAAATGLNYGLVSGALAGTHGSVQGGLSGLAPLPVAAQGLQAMLAAAAAAASHGASAADITASLQSVLSTGGMPSFSLPQTSGNGSSADPAAAALDLSYSSGIDGIGGAVDAAAHTPASFGGPDPLPGGITHGSLHADGGALYPTSFFLPSSHVLRRASPTGQLGKVDEERVCVGPVWPGGSVYEADSDSGISTTSTTTTTNPGSGLHSGCASRCSFAAGEASALSTEADANCTCSSMGCGAGPGPAAGTAAGANAPGSALLNGHGHMGGVSCDGFAGFSQRQVPVGVGAGLGSERPGRRSRHSSSAATRSGNSRRTHGAASGTASIPQELLDLACCDCTDASAGDIWSSLLPLASQCIELESKEGPGGVTLGSAQTAGPRRPRTVAASHPTSESSLDVFAY